MGEEQVAITEKVETPTKSVDPKQLESELAQSKEVIKSLEQKAKTLEDNWKNEQRNSSKKDQELQKLKDIRADIEDLKGTQKILVAHLAQQSGQDAEEYNEQLQNKKPDLLKEYQRLTETQQLQRKGDEYREKVEALGYTKDDEEYHDIRKLVVQGDFEYADFKLKKLKPKQDSEPPEINKEEKGKKVTETEDQKIVRLVEEGVRKQLEAMGQLKTGLNAPAGTGSGKKPSFEELKAASPWEYEQNVKSGKWIGV